MTGIIHTAKYWKIPKNLWKTWKPPQRQKTNTAGGWIYDLVGLGKAIVLCTKCQNKFNPAKAGYKYSRIGGYTYVISDCDGCKVRRERCKLYQKISL